MKAVLISIQPPHTENIFSFRKEIEWRTKPMPRGKHYCYETKNGGGAGKVIGEYTIWSVVRYDNISRIPEGIIVLGCVPKAFLHAYSKGRPLYAHYICNPIRYDKPKELSEFSKYGFDRPAWLKRPPQSWCYVETKARYIDAEIAIEKCNKLIDNADSCPNPYAIEGVRVVRNVILSECETGVPTAEVAEVVRCKDCKHYRYYGKTSLFVNGKNVDAGWCMRRTRQDEENRMLPSDFCSYGERSKNEK